MVSKTDLKEIRSKLMKRVAAAAPDEQLQVPQDDLKRMLDELNGHELQVLVLTEQIDHLRTIDMLTGMLTRRAWESNLHEEWKRARRNTTSLSVVIFDIDQFQDFNKRYGLQAGDICLQRVARQLAFSLQRPGDKAGRWGDDKFVALLPETNQVGAMHVAQLVLRNIYALNIRHEGSLQDFVTLSAGVATIVPERQADANTGPNKLLSTAERALDRAATGPGGQAVALPLTDTDERPTIDISKGVLK